MGQQSEARDSARLALYLSLISPVFFFLSIFLFRTVISILGLHLGLADLGSGVGAILMLLVIISVPLGIVSFSMGNKAQAILGEQGLPTRTATIGMWIACLNILPLLPLAMLLLGVYLDSIIR
jgi:hypothetical protein